MDRPYQHIIRQARASTNQILNQSSPSQMSSIPEGASAFWLCRIGVYTTSQKRMSNFRMPIANCINQGVPLALRLETRLPTRLRKNTHDLLLDLSLRELLLRAH